MATLGKTTSGTNATQSSGNKTVVSPFTAGASGVLANGYVRARVDTGTGTIRAVVYADSSGAPGAKIAESDAISVTNTTIAELTGPFSGANLQSIVSGTVYHIGASWPDPGSNNIEYERDNTASQRNEQTSDRPDPFGTPSLTSGGPIAAYVDFFPAVVTDDGAFFEFF